MGALSICDKTTFDLLGDENAQPTKVSLNFIELVRHLTLIMTSVTDQYKKKIVLVLPTGIKSDCRRVVDKVH
jgi:hypothetical protein